MQLYKHGFQRRKKRFQFNRKKKFKNIYIIQSDIGNIHPKPVFRNFHSLLLLNIILYFRR